jgi:signal peptidase I
LSPSHEGRIIQLVRDPPFSTSAPPEWGASASPARRPSVWRAIWEILQTLLIAGVLFIVVNLTTARIRVEGSSMEPSLHDGELVVVSRLAYRWTAPQRGDIIVFHLPHDPDRRLIKRLIGLPGDVISIEAGEVRVNGVALQEPYIAAPPRYSGEWIVGPEEAFVLGDNRNNSSDSPNWGMLPLGGIIGKAILVYWPLPEIGPIPHYDLILPIPG